MYGWLRELPKDLRDLGSYEITKDYEKLKPSQNYNIVPIPSPKIKTLPVLAKSYKLEFKTLSQ